MQVGPHRTHQANTGFTANEPSFESGILVAKFCDDDLSFEITKSMPKIPAMIFPTNKMYI